MILKSLLLYVEGGLQFSSEPGPTKLGHWCTHGYARNTYVYMSRVALLYTKYIQYMYVVEGEYTV